MSGKKTTKMIEAYTSQRQGMFFFTGMFRTPEENFHNSESIEVDIITSDESVSIPVTSIEGGTRIIAQDLFTNKEFTPPIYSESTPFNASDLLKREPGVNPFEDQGFQAKMSARALRQIRKLENRQRRGIELQASQLLQTGVLTLVNKDNNAVYEIDYEPKASHFPTVTTAWSAAGSDPINDLLPLINEIDSNGQVKPDMLVFGQNAFERFIQNEKVQKRLDLRHLDRGGIVPMNPVDGSGGQYHGTLDIGNYKMDIWTYNGKYDDPVTGNKVPFMDDDKVVVRASAGRLDATYGAVPRYNTGMTAPVSLPARISEPGRMDLNMFSYVTVDGKTMFIELASRPLLIPTARETFGCLITEL